MQTTFQAKNIGGIRSNYIVVYAKKESHVRDVNLTRSNR